MPIVIHVPTALIALYWYFVVQVLAIFLYATWVRFQLDLFSQDFINTYLAFAIIGMLGYAFGGGPFFFAAFKYSRTAKSRSLRTRIGLVVMYFTSTLPLFIMDLWIVYNNGIVNVLQGICFVIQLVSWFFGSFAVWFIYMWQVAKFVHKRRGGGRPIMFQQGVGQQTAGTPPRPRLMWSPGRGSGPV